MQSGVRFIDAWHSTCSILFMKHPETIHENTHGMPERLNLYLQFLPASWQLFLIDQWRGFFGGLMECECGRIVGTRDTFRCFYCGVWYCAECAGSHFGQTFDDYHRRNIVMRRLEDEPNEWDFEI
jgi:hypothetical protein